MSQITAHLFKVRAQDELDKLSKNVKERQDGIEKKISSDIFIFSKRECQFSAHVCLSARNLFMQFWKGACAKWMRVGTSCIPYERTI